MQMRVQCRREIGLCSLQGLTGDSVGISHECRITGIGKSDPIDMRGFGPR